MWDMVFNRRVLFGENRIDEIPKLLAWHGCKKAFLVTFHANPSVRTRLEQKLKESGIETVVYDKIKGEPDLTMIDTGREFFVSNRCDCTVAVGGGSIIDAAKMINMMAVNGGTAEEYQMYGRQATKTPPFFIAAPTTAGTGAEATKVAVVTNTRTGLKKSVYHPTMIADVAVLDPLLTVSMPKRLTAATGMDALSHAIESYVSLQATPITKLYGREAICLVKRSLARACENPQNIEARQEMLLASYFGGCAISAGIGIAHIMAQPLGAMYHIPHGDACSIFLPLAMEFNKPYATREYAEIAQVLGVDKPTADDEENAQYAIEEVQRIRAMIGAPDSLAPYVQGKDIDMESMVQTVQNTTGHIKSNPRPVDEQSFREMFHLAMQSNTR